MSLHSLAALQAKQRNLDLLVAQSGNLYDLFKELQGFTVSVGVGAGVSTNIAVTGITTTDTLISVLELTVAAGDIQTVVDRTATSSITSAGNIRCTDDTTGSQILVFWFNKV